MKFQENNWRNENYVLKGANKSNFIRVVVSFEEPIRLILVVVPYVAEGLSGLTPKLIPPFDYRQFDGR